MFPENGWYDAKSDTLIVEAEIIAKPSHSKKLGIIWFY